MGPRRGGGPCASAHAPPEILERRLLGSERRLGEALERIPAGVHVLGAEPEVAAADPAHVGEIQRGPPGVAVDAVVDADEAAREYLEAGLLEDLSADGLGRVLAALDEAAREIP